MKNHPQIQNATTDYPNEITYEKVAEKVIKNVLSQLKKVHQNMS